MIQNGRMDRLSKQNGKQLLHFRTCCGKCRDISDCCINLCLVFVYIYIFFMFLKCNVRDCASVKSVVIVFDDRSDVLENYEGYCT